MRRLSAILLGLALLFNASVGYAKSASVDAKPVYVMIAVWLKDGKSAEKNYKKYVRRSMVVMEDYNGKLVGIYEPVRQLAGKEFAPDAFGIVKWKSQKHLNKFLKDPAYKKAIKVKDKAIVRESILITSALKNVPETAKGRKGTYVLSAVWLDPNTSESTYKRELKSFVRIAKRYGGKSAGAFKATKVDTGNFTPDAIGLMQWPGKGSMMRFASSSSYKDFAQHSVKPKELVIVEAKRVKLR